MSNLVLQKFVPSHVRKVFFENQELRIPASNCPRAFVNFQPKIQINEIDSAEAFL